MHIGVDLDNTILDATSTHLHYYNQVSGLSFTPTVHFHPPNFGKPSNKQAIQNETAQFDAASPGNTYLFMK